MAFDWNFDLQGLDWNELSELYHLAPLGEKKPHDLERVFGNSMFHCFVRDSGKLIAAGRALADGRDCSYLCDVAVHPNYQGLGLGKAVVGKLIELSKGHNKIMLYSAPGKEAFYKQLGFKRLTTGMAIFEDPDHALAAGLIEDS